MTGFVLRINPLATDDDKPYSVEPEQRGVYRVVFGQTVVCTCVGESNAQQYATLLNQAYQRGHKAGYRAGKEAAGKRP